MKEPFHKIKADCKFKSHFGQTVYCKHPERPNGYACLKRLCPEVKARKK